MCIKPTKNYSKITTTIEILQFPNLPKNYRKFEDFNKRRSFN